jgi:two-component system sensor histidine kinase UhpB
LHDRIGQNLALLNIDLDISASQLQGTCADIVKPRLTEARALVETTIAHVRNVLAELRPPALDDYGLAAALRAYSTSLSASTGLLVRFDGADITPRPAPLTETALFRIAQEALMNAAKHAGAGSIAVELTATASIIALTITDDGVGFDKAFPGANRAAWGITTMRERAEAVGAVLDIDAQPGAGTRVRVTLEL